MTQEVLKSWLGKLDTMLEFDESIDVNSVEELKAKYDEFVEKFHCEFRDCEVTCDKTCKKCIVASVDEYGNFYCPYYDMSAGKPRFQSWE